MVEDIWPTRAIRRLPLMIRLAMRPWLISQLPDPHPYHPVPNRLRVDGFLEIEPIMPTDWPEFTKAKHAAGQGYDTLCIQLIREWRREYNCYAHRFLHTN